MEARLDYIARIASQVGAGGTETITGSRDTTMS